MKRENIFLSTLTALAVLFAIKSCKKKKGCDHQGHHDFESLKKHLISPEKANLLAKEYENKNYGLLNKERKTPDTKQVNYRLEDLENYLEFVKKETKKKGIKDYKIAVVFGQYPENDHFDDRLNPKFKGQQTLFLKPILDHPHINSDFFSKLSLLKNSNSDSDDTGIDALDFGQLTPPER